MSLVQECTGQIMFGAVAGAVPFAVIGYQMAKARGAIGGALVGGVIGAFSGLDSALPVPPRTSFDRGKGPVMGPFRAGASYVLAALALAVGGFYLWGKITLECTRGDGGVLCSRVTTGWMNNAETSRVDYGPIVTAYRGRSRSDCLHHAGRAPRRDRRLRRHGAEPAQNVSGVVGIDAACAGQQHGDRASRYLGDRWRCRTARRVVATNRSEAVEEGVVGGKEN